MTNRQNLLQSSEYDTLCKMQMRLITATKGATPCIMHLLGEKDVWMRHDKFKGECPKCIAAWLNQKVGETGVDAVELHRVSSRPKSEQYACTNCGEFCYYPHSKKEIPYRFCPNCGKKVLKDG